MKLALAIAAALTLAAAPNAFAQMPSDPGPCSQSAALGMPEGDDHDHNEASQHQGMYCRIRKVDFNALKSGELTGNEDDGFAPDSKLGEMDIKGDIAAVAVQEPVGGVLFFNVANPAKPQFLGRFKHAACALGSNCGAYVELTADAQYALLAVQQTDLMPGLAAGNQGQSPGVAIIDIRDPKSPKLVHEYTTVSVQGIHTVRSHVIKEGSAAGEYAFLIQNGVGVEIARMQDGPTGRGMVRISNIPEPDETNITSTHDTFIQTDPFDGKTYLYTAGGFTYGFRVYDVTNPVAPMLVGEWDPTPQCRNDWYAHTIDVTHRGGRRYVTMPAEAFDFGAQSDASEECGDKQGNGDKPGPMWIVDATDFAKLGQDGDSDDEIKQKSADALVATWTNPAGRAAGQLTFSPHNQQIVGDKIYLSHYHGGIFVLDASAAFSGRKERPKEIGWAVPFEPDVRPTIEGGTFPHSRGDYWDMVFHKGYIIATDIKGGFYALQEVGPDAPVGPGGGDNPVRCAAFTPPVSMLKRIKLSRKKGLRLRGTTRPGACGGAVQRVLVAVGLQGKKRKCRFLNAKGKLGKSRSCRKPRFVPAARGSGTFSLRIKGRLRKGTYRIGTRAIDSDGVVEKTRFKRRRLRR